MKENGLMVEKMEPENIYSPTEINMKDILKKVLDKVKEHIPGGINLIIKGNGKKIVCMEKENIYPQMAKWQKDISKKIIL